MTKVYFSIIFLVRIYLIFYEDEFFKFHENIVLAKCDQASDLWQQLKLASELESDL